MKTNLIQTILTFSFILLMAGAGHAEKNDSLFCLRIRGKVLNADEGYSTGCKVQLLNSRGVIDSAVIRNGKCKFTFRLKRNDFYAIRIQKSGYVSRLISVNTEFPGEIHDMCEFSFNTNLISEEEAELLNKDELDFPVAIVHFEKETETFVYNREYSERHKSALKEKKSRKQQNEDKGIEVLATSN